LRDDQLSFSRILVQRSAAHVRPHGIYQVRAVFDHGLDAFDFVCLGGSARNQKPFAAILAAPSRFISNPFKTPST